MSRPRLTIAQLISIVLSSALVSPLCETRTPSGRAVFTVAVISVSVALVAAFVRRGNGRAAWAGYAAAGWASLVIWLATQATVGYVSGPPRLFVYWALHTLMPSIQPAASAGAPYTAYAQISHSLEVIALGLLGAIFGGLLALKDDRPNP